MSPSRQRGFTLIEVVVAFAIFTLSVTALYEIFGSAARRSAQTRLRDEQWLTAQSVLSEFRAAPGPWMRESNGKSSSGQTWNLTTRPYESGADTQGNWHAYEVTVSVSDQNASVPVVLRSIELMRSTP